MMRVGLGSAIACVASLLTWVAAAQSIDTDQLTSIFSGLSSDQQQALAQQLGGTAGGSTGNSGSGSNGANSRNRAGAAENTINSQQRLRQRAVEDDNEMLPSALQRLRPLDTVLLEVENKGVARTKSRTCKRG